MLKHSLCAVVVAGLLLVLAVAASAQPPEPPGPAAGPAADQQDRGNRGNRMDMAQMQQRMDAGRMMQPQPTPAMVVADGFVYVVFGGTLFQFTVDGLKLQAQAQLMQLLPRQTPPGAPMKPAPGGPATIAPMPGMPGPK